jgi:hypothetical protein
MLSFRRRTTGIHAIFIGTLLFSVSPPRFATAQSISSRPTNAVTSETAERTLRSQWRTLLDNHSWAELDSLASRLRNQRLRFQGGGWQLHVLYNILSTARSEGESDMAWERQIAALQDWVRSAPSSPTPRIALADGWENFAWKARGSGFADTVAPEAWNLFEERIEKARQVLEESEEIGRGDPEWYNAMLSVATDQGWNREQVDKLANEALSREPGYFYVARTMANYLLPKWNGAPGDTEEFVARTADRIGGTDGDATYFFIAETVLGRRALR